MSWPVNASETLCKSSFLNEVQQYQNHSKHTLGLDLGGVDTHGDGVGALDGLDRVDKGKDKVPARVQDLLVLGHPRLSRRDTHQPLAGRGWDE